MPWCRRDMFLCIIVLIKNANIFSDNKVCNIKNDYSNISSRLTRLFVAMVAQVMRMKTRKMKKRVMKTRRLG